MAGVTVIVGANNSGKSTFLREIFQLISAEQKNSTPRRHIIKDCILTVEGTPENLIDTLREGGTYVDRQPNSGFMIENQIIPEPYARDRWHRAGKPDVTGTLGRIAPFFVHYVNTANRASGISPQQRRPNIEDIPQSPMHRLEDNPEMLERVREISLRIFRQTLTLDRLSNNVQLRVGAPNIPAPPVDAVTREYRDALISLEPLQNQGDGMTAVLGLLVPIICGSQDIILIDEPEAFLHPPQARIIGTLLGELSQERDMQLFMATHDRNILVGLLQSQVPVTVIRLDRCTSPTRIHELDYSRVRTLWDDPVLRYSNLLDGLFHHAVVLCEAERDCTFYAASLDAANENSGLDFSPGDILFVPAGGKDGFPGMTTALKAVSVPVVAIPDIDLFDDKNKVRTLVDAMGGNWISIEPTYRIATAPFQKPRRQFKNAQILETIRKVLEPAPEAAYDRGTEEAIKAAMRSDPSPWEDLKKFGVSAFRGQERQAAANLIQNLQELGIVVVQDGELENLAPTVGSRKGKRWLSEALETEAYRDQRAQTHIDHVIDAIKHRLQTSS